MAPSSLFILVSSVCKSLKCLIFNLTQGAEGVIYLGSLDHLCCGEGGTLKTNTIGVCGCVCMVWTTLGLSPLTVPVLSWSILLRFQVALKGNYSKWALGFEHLPDLSCSGSVSRVLHKATDSIGSVFCALPRSKELRRPGIWWKHHPRCAVHLITAVVPAAQFPGCAARAPSQVCCVSPLVGWYQAVTLLADVNCLGFQEDFISNWEPAHSLVEDAGRLSSLGPRLPFTFWLWLSLTCLSASGRGMGQSEAS